MLVIFALILLISALIGYHYESKRTVSAIRASRHSLISDNGYSALESESAIARGENDRRKSKHTSFAKAIRAITPRALKTPACESWPAIDTETHTIRNLAAARRKLEKGKH